MVRDWIRTQNEPDTERLPHTKSTARKVNTMMKDNELSGPALRRGGDILVESLVAQGVERVFCVPGESYLPVLDALHDVSDDIQVVVCRQEGGAAYMADAHSKLTGKPGVCMVTRGPGATNASVGIHTSLQDSTPVVLLVGQVDRRIRDREGFQEVDFRAMFGPLAKWVAEIDDPARVPEYIHRAFQTAISGRPGPVVLSLPEDMLSEAVPATIKTARPAETIGTAPAPSTIPQLQEMIETAERPIVILGGGNWSEETGRNIADFATKFGVPVATSLRCQDYIPNSHPNHIGHMAIAIEPTLARRVREADLLLVIGARLGEMTTVGYTLIEAPRPRQKLIHVHVDPSELGSVYQADLAINSDNQHISQALAALSPTRSRDSKWLEGAREDFEASLVPPAEITESLDLARAVVRIRDRMPRDTIVTSGAGNYTGWVHKYWPFETWRSQLAPTSGSMGYGVPAAVAAKLAAPEREVVCFAGDGCFMMNGQEMASAVQHGARILYVVVNNGMYGTIRMHQEREFPARVFGTKLYNPDFVTLAKAYGLWGERVAKLTDLDDALDRAIASPTGALIELITDPEVISVRSTITSIRNRNAGKG